MMNYDFRVKGDKAYYGASPFFRLFCALFLVFLLYGVISLYSSDGFSSVLVIPSIVIFILFFALIYRDECIFDNERKVAIIILGIGPFVRRKVIAYQDIKWIEISHFVRGRAGIDARPSAWAYQEQIALSIRLGNEAETKYDLDLMSSRKSRGRLERIAGRISSFAGLALHVDKTESSPHPFRR